jgi:CcmD family protein
MIKYLFAAYAATWLIHLGYLAILARGFKQVRKELEEVSRSSVVDRR